MDQTYKAAGYGLRNDRLVFLYNSYYRILIWYSYSCKLFPLV